MSLGARAIAWLAAVTAGQVEPTTRRRPRGRAPAGRGWGRWLGDPRAAVLIVLFLIVGAGGGRRLLHAWRARGAVGRLGEPDVSAREVEAAVEFGREGLMDLFRLLGTAESSEVRQAAGRALSILWAHDELIAEEEKALVRLAYSVSWRARRRYPRDLRGVIPISVSYGIPFLRGDGDQGRNGIALTNLEWSHTIDGARRASLEVPSPWKAGPGRAEFGLVPGDFETNGPFRLSLRLRVRTAGLTEPWELELPHMPFSFEFDPRLSVDALFNQPDAARGEAIARAVRLEPPGPEEGRGATFLELNEAMALRVPPILAVTTPLPCDLAHAIHLEFDGVDGRFAAGELILSGQGTRAADLEMPTIRRFPLGPIASLPVEALGHPGTKRLRAVLVADAERGWADPEVRSIWPEAIVTDWLEVEVVRR
jgi:hypothetical protein